jgi:hypothetical protein
MKSDHIAKPIPGVPMRRRAFCSQILLCLFLATTPLLAVGTTKYGVQWEVRTTGNDSNGGGFWNGYSGSESTCAAGTDWSQQNSAHVVFDGSIIAATTSGTSATITINGGYTVASTDVCNVLHILGGTNFTAGLYVIISVNTGANTWTLDANVSSGSGSAMTGNMGGGWLTLTQAVANWGNSATLWIKAGTYTLTTTLVPVAVSNARYQPETMYGYDATHGDSGARPLITTATNSTALFTISATMNNAVFKNLSFSNTASTRAACWTVVVTTSRVTFDTVLMDGCQRGIDTLTYNLTVINSEIKNSISHGIYNGAGGKLVNNYIHNNGGSGFAGYDYGVQFVNMTLIGNYFYANGENGAYTLYADVAAHGNVFSDNASDGLQIAFGSTATAGMVFNNVFYNNGGYGSDVGASSVQQSYNIVQASNAYGANALGPRLGLAAGPGDVTLTADPFTARTSANLALNSTSGGGAALKAVGFPGVTLFGTGYLSIGALQSQGSSGGFGCGWAH